MSLSQLTLPELSYVMACLARAAYEDDCRAIFAEQGFTKNYKFMDVDGAQGHLCCSNDELLITFRGTEPSQFNDLVADLNTIPKKNGPGKVHEGFRKEARKLYDIVIAYVKANKGRKIFITGHSLGAAMATYTAQELNWLKMGDDIKLFTFGSPRLGDYDYVNAMDIEHHRFVNCNDVVTHVPPAALMFKHHGNLHYINFYGNVRDLSRWQRIKDSMRSHWRALQKFQLFDGLHDHSMDGYVSKLKKVKDENQEIE
jgi:hypothetical protein